MLKILSKCGFSKLGTRKKKDRIFRVNSCRKPFLKWRPESLKFLGLVLLHFKAQCINTGARIDICVKAGLEKCWLLKEEPTKVFFSVHAWSELCDKAVAVPYTERSRRQVHLCQ